MHRAATLTVFGLMLLFAAWFSAYGIRLHDAQLTHRSDLGQVDQAVWNTSRGRLLEFTRADQPSTRLTDHVEPIFVLVSPVLWLWDDVRGLLILQAVLLAAGAWPIYRFAQRRLAHACAARHGESAHADLAGVAAVSTARLSEWGGVAFAAAYLLTPALQAAAVSEFHALPLAAPFIAAGLWAVESRRWGWFAACAVLVATTQEGAALLTLTLGLYAAARALSLGPRAAFVIQSLPGLVIGLAVALFGLAWFYVTTFVIIPRFAAEAYAISQTPYAARYGALGDSFRDVVVAIIARPLTVLRIAAEPLRVAYLAGLLLPVAGLALLGPELLLVSLPLLLANLLSSYPLQYSGELHYSAALVPFFIAAGAVGAARLLAWRPVRTLRAAPFILCVAVFACALGYQWVEGFTPLGREFRVSGWPAVTAHERLLSRFAGQIPPTAALSTIPSLHPHFAHRRQIYVFPTLADADYVLVDVSGTTDQHPIDVKTTLDGLLASGGFGVLDAADGYLLLQRGAAAAALPPAFCDFTRADAAPEHPVSARFGDGLTLAGYSIEDNRKWRATRFRFYWQVTAALPDASIHYWAATPDGAIVDDAALRPLPALLWCPPSTWQPGETRVIETLPWYLPAAWAPILAVDVAGQPAWPVDVQGAAVVSPEGRLRLPAWARAAGALVPYPAPRGETAPADATFATGDWRVRLAASQVPSRVAAGDSLPVALRWIAPGPAPRDDSVFVHLRDAAGQTVARGDAGPAWFVAWPASRWPAPADLWDAHRVALPADLPAGPYSLVIGWYDWQTGARSSVVDAAGNPQGDEYVLGTVTVDPQAGPEPDACCRVVDACCASQE